MAQYSDCRIVTCEPTVVDGCWYIVTEGHLDAGPPLRAWEDQVQTVIDNGTRWIIFDVRSIKTYVDCGHGAMMKFASLLRSAGGGAVLLRMDKRNRIAFQLLGMEHFFHFAEVMDEALAVARSGVASGSDGG